MKRLQFTSAMSEAVRKGKRCTTRKLSNKINVGDEFAAVIGRTTPADAGFAVCRCTQVVFLTPFEIAQKYFKEEGFETPSAYLDYWQDLNPQTLPSDLQKLIGFEVLRWIE